MENLIIIESIQETDIENIIRIQTENDLSQWRTQDYFEEIHRADSVAYSAKKNNSTVGFIVSRLITINLSNGYNQSRNILPSKTETEIEIFNLAIDKKYQKEGIGTLLIQKVIQTGVKHGTTSIWLEVRASNSAAIALYEKNKFRETYQRKNFYNHPQEDALVMKLDIYNNLIQPDL